MFLIKLGGSVITEKTKEQPIFKKQITDHVARVIQKAEADVVVVHGAGSFGHVLAKKYNLLVTGGSDYHGDKDEVIGFYGDERQIPVNLYDNLISFIEKNN